MFLHGREENGDGDGQISKVQNSTNQANLLLNAEKYGFGVLAPQLVPKLTGWQVTWVEEYTGACVDYALQNLTKQSKVGLTGLSQGGGGTWRAITNPLASKIMFAIAICPTPEFNGDFSQIAKNHVPLWNFHAINDSPPTDIQGSRTMIKAAQAHNPDPAIKFDELASGGHAIWGSVYGRQDLYNWIMDQYELQGSQPTTPPVVEDKIIYSIQITKYASGKIETKELTL